MMASRSVLEDGAGISDFGFRISDFGFQRQCHRRPVGRRCDARGGDRERGTCRSGASGRKRIHGKCRRFQPQADDDATAGKRLAAGFRFCTVRAGAGCLACDFSAHFRLERLPKEVSGSFLPAISARTQVWRPMPPQARSRSRKILSADAPTVQRTSAIASPVALLQSPSESRCRPSGRRRDACPLVPG